MVPASDSFVDWIELKLCVAGEDPFSIFTYLSRSMHRMLVDFSHNASVAYLETDYFGGVGAQMAVGYSQGQVAIDPLHSEAKHDGQDVIHTPKGVEPINQVLKFLGVSVGDDFDEFDALELGQYRHTPTMY